VTDYLDRWLSAGAITPEQHRALTALVRRERFPVFVELNALLYLGVIAFASGLAWTTRTYAAQWGDAAILLPTTGLLVACLWYCFSRVPPFSPGHVEAPGLVFDYVLYLACLVFAVELAYVEYRFEVLQERWDNYLLMAAVLYLAAAYRFDNRFVLSLGIATLGSWFGVRISRVDLLSPNLFRTSALGYGTTVGLIGWYLWSTGIKRHFLETYLHIAANVILAALVSGIADRDGPSIWLLGVLLAATATAYGGVRFRRFAFVVYGALYGYLGVSWEMLRHIRGDTAMLGYIVLSAGLMVLGLVVLSRRFGRDA
jgi:hypothetical protein